MNKEILWVQEVINKLQEELGMYIDKIAWNVLK
jgi:hypothetical protein